MHARKHIHTYTNIRNHSCTLRVCVRTPVSTEMYISNINPFSQMGGACVHTRKHRDTHTYMYFYLLTHIQFDMHIETLCLSICFRVNEYWERSRSVGWKWHVVQQSPCSSTCDGKCGSIWLACFVTNHWVDKINCLTGLLVSMYIIMHAISYLYAANLLTVSHVLVFSGAYRGDKYYQGVYYRKARIICCSRYTVLNIVK